MDFSESMVNNDLPTIKEEAKTLLSLCVDTLLGHSSIPIEIMIRTTKEVSTVPERLFINRFESFLKGGFTDKEKRRKLAEHLRDEEGNDEHLERLIKCINDAESIRTAKYMSNAAVALCNEKLDRIDFFRILHAINSMVEEDLEYLNKIYGQEDIAYSSHIPGLKNGGLVEQIGIDEGDFSDYGRDWWEMQHYAITPLGKLVYEYCLVWG